MQSNAARCTVIRPSVTPTNNGLPETNKPSATLRRRMDTNVFSIINMCYNIP